MTKFEKYLLEQENQILEFANMGSNMHNFGVDVRLHIMQPADKELVYAPRVKIMKKGVSGSFSITLTKEPMVIGQYKNFVTTKELNVLLDKIKTYKDAFLTFWYDPNMDTNELKDLFRQIDQGFSIEYQREKAYYQTGDNDLK